MTAEDDILKTLDALELDNMTREIEQLVQLAKGKGLPEEARGAFQQAEGQIQGVEAEAKEAGGEDKGDKRDSHDTKRSTEKIAKITKEEKATLEGLWRDFGQLENDLQSIAQLDVTALRKGYITREILKKGADLGALKKSLADEAVSVKLVNDRLDKCQEGLRIAFNLISRFDSDDKEFDQLKDSGIFPPDQVRQLHEYSSSLVRWFNGLHNELMGIKQELLRIQQGLSTETQRLGSAIKEVEGAQKGRDARRISKASDDVRKTEAAIEKFLADMGVAEKSLVERVHHYREQIQRVYQTYQSEISKLRPSEAA